MLTRLIKLFSGGLDSPLSRRGAISDEQEEKIATGLIPAKFRADVETLQEIYKTEFVAGLSINWSLQQALEILPRNRKRVDSYDSLIKFLKQNLGITLTIKSNKTN